MDTPLVPIAPFVHVHKYNYLEQPLAESSQTCWPQGDQYKQISLYYRILSSKRPSPYKRPPPMFDEPINGSLSDTCTLYGLSV